jgi:hypothetical protein
MPNILYDAGRELLADLFRDPHLVLLCPLNEESGESIRSWRVTPRRSGTVNGSPTYGVDLGNGIKGITFARASSHRVAFGDLDELDFGASSPFSVLALTKPVSITNAAAIVGKYDAVSGWVFGHDASGRPILYIASNAVAGAAIIGRRSTTALVNGTTKMVGASYSGSGVVGGIAIYGDGTAESTADDFTTALGTVTNSHDVRIGAQADSTAHLDASLAFVAVFNAAKAAHEFRRWAWLAGQV